MPEVVDPVNWRLRPGRGVTSQEQRLPPPIGAEHRGKEPVIGKIGVLWFSPASTPGADGAVRS